MGIAARLAPLLLAGLPVAALAQSVNDYQLPSGGRSGPSAQGPVDSDAPVVRTPRRPQPTPPPQPSQRTAAAPPAPVAQPDATRQPSPAPHPSASPVARPSPSATAEERERPPRDEEPRAEPPPIEQPAPLPQASSEPTIATAPSPAIATPPVASAAPTSEQPGILQRAGAQWPWIVGGLAALALLAALLRRRNRSDDDYADEQREVTPTRVVTPPRAVARPAPAPQPAMPLPEPEIGRLPAPVALTLEAQRMSATLLNTTLSYTLNVTNVTDQTLGPVAILCDLSSAHSSLPAKLQLEVGTQVTEPNHRLRALEPGETATLKGELKLPLTDVLTIKAGRKSLFVPLARFRVEAWRNNRPQVFRRAFVIGQIQADPNAALKPFRLDLGPRLYSRVSQRELAVA